MKKIISLKDKIIKNSYIDYSFKLLGFIGFSTLHIRGQLWESEVVFMIDFLMFLIIGLMVPSTINVALLTVIFTMWINKE